MTRNWVLLVAFSLGLIFHIPQIIKAYKKRKAKETDSENKTLDYYVVMSIIFIAIILDKLEQIFNWDIF